MRFSKNPFMGSTLRILPSKLIIGLIFSEADQLAKTESLLEKKFGAIDYKSTLIPFTWTSYYQKELGGPLFRKFVSFKKLIHCGDLARIKAWTNELEKKLILNKKRTINIDPGYVSLSKLVLATTKNFTHRIYLDNGIFAEVTLYYKKDRFESGPWTYPDFKTPEYLLVFNAIRSIYHDQILKNYGSSQLYRCP